MDETIIDRTGLKSAYAAYAAIAVANDMKYIHLHACGDQFDRIHSIAEEYYSAASEQADTLAEFALEHNGPIKNFSTAASIIGWKFETEEEYYSEDAYVAMVSITNRYIKVLLNLRRCIDDESMQSTIDEFVRYWRKELLYKLKQRTMQ
jgi:DNA-binding ferritin-like protein